MRRNCCRSCGSPQLGTAYDFGMQPLAGNFPLVPEAEHPVRRYPLDLAVCDSCTLLQVTYLPPIEEIFNSDYRYASSTVPALKKHFEEYADWLHARLPAGARILEFGCNDGILLEKLAEKGFGCHGVDASQNMVEIARAKGLRIDNAFFNLSFVQSTDASGAYDLVTCSNVYAHIDDLADTARAVSLALKDGGIFCIEVHDGATIATLNQFDTVYHEHLTYFTEASISLHLSTYGFKVDCIERTKMHGGGLRVLSTKVRLMDGASDAAPKLVGRGSRELGETIQLAIEDARRDLHGLHRDFGPLWAYGAAGRSQMFLNFTASSDLFKAVFDDSQLRQGRYVAGTNLPIVAYDGLRRPGCCVILAWNYAEDISAKVNSRFDAVYTVLPRLTRW
jgi:SAM-dependent methyltransferase